MGPLEVVGEIGEILDGLTIPWVLGGSLASSLAGEPRSTLDVDIAARLESRHVAGLILALDDKYYADRSMIEASISRHSSFNLIHLESFVKIDIFVLGDGVLDTLQIKRRQRIRLGDKRGSVWVGSPEDQILRKLHWFKLGGEVSDRQWSDVVGLLRVQGERIDRRGLAATADLTDLADLVAKALVEADTIT